MLYSVFFFCRVQQEEEKDEAEDIYGGTTDDEKEETTNKDISPQEMQGQERYISYFINSSEFKKCIPEKFADKLKIEQNFRLGSVPRQ